MVADFWSGLDPTDPTGSAGPDHTMYTLENQGGMLVRASLPLDGFQ